MAADLPGERGARNWTLRARLTLATVEDGGDDDSAAGRRPDADTDAEAEGVEWLKEGGGGGGEVGGRGGRERAWAWAVRPRVEGRSAGCSGWREALAACWGDTMVLTLSMGGGGCGPGTVNGGDGGGGGEWCSDQASKQAGGRLESNVGIRFSGGAWHRVPEQPVPFCPPNLPTYLPT